MASEKKMALKCAKTGRLFFSTEEATEHAEAFGAAYANFEEVAMDSKVWVCMETGRPAYTEAEMQRIKQRDPDSKTFEEKTVAYLLDLHKKKASGSSAPSGGPNRVLDALLGGGTTDGDVVMTDASADAPPADAAAAASAEPDERKVGDPNPPEVKEKVSQELKQQVMEMGFSELRAEKALFRTDNAGLEYAVNWLAEHENDADIDLPLLKPAPAPPEKPKMSKEEAEAKALELQKKLRQKKAEEEKLSEKEKERMRIESTKMMLEANEKLQEQERKRAIEQLKREKEAHDQHRQELKEKMRLDYIERFGKEPPPEEEGQEQAIKEKSSKDQVAFFLSKLKKNYKDADSEGLRTCLSTLRLYVKNLQDNPQDPKFKKLKLDNKAFQTRIAPYDGAIDFLDAIGFEKKDDCLEQRKSVPDGWLCGNALKFIDLILSQI